jgi:hypothetical protein
MGSYILVRLLQGRTKPVEKKDDAFYMAHARYEREGAIRACNIDILAASMVSDCNRRLW